MLIGKKLLVFLATCMAVVLCMYGICACGKDDEQFNQNLPAENTYFFQEIEISGNSVLRVGGTVVLSATASARTGAGKYVSSTEGFTFESSNSFVATVDSNGVVSGIKEGNCDITIKHAEFQAEKKFSVSVVATVNLDFADGEGINTFGRAQSKDNGLLFVNALSGFEVCFDGTELKGVFNLVTEGGNNKDYLLVQADGKSEIKEIYENSVDVQISLVSGLSSGVHTVKVYKLTDEKHSSLRLISLSSDVHYLNSPVRPQKKISFYGDYLTLGYGLGKGIDASKTYAYKAAEELGAEIDIFGASDSALAFGATPIKDVWDNLSVRSKEVYEGVADSDYIVINLGENDGKAIKQSDGTVTDFIDGYRDMIAAMRAKNANAKIICCYGMTAYGSVLAQPILRLVAVLNNLGDKNIYALQLERCDGKAIDDKTGYPNVYGHEINAKRLIDAFIKLENGDNVSSVQDRVKYDPAKNDMSVILLGGQSNMEGNSWWKYLEGKDERFNDYLNGFDGIKLSFVNHESEASKSPSFNPVKLGYGGARNPGNGGDSTTCFGPEIGMAKTLHDNGYDGKVVFIKFAIGGTYFHEDGYNRNWQAFTGTLYKAFIQYTDACIAELSKTYNVSIDAMCWMQGESDTEQQDHVDAYGDSLIGFVNALREHFAKYNPDFMFYDAYINWPKAWQGDRPDQINDIKKQLAQENLHYEIIDTLAAKLHSYNEPYENVDLAHFDAESEIKLGEMFAEAYMKDFPLIS